MPFINQQQNDMEGNIIVRYEPYYGEWITMDEKGNIFSVEFEPDFNPSDYPNIIRVDNSKMQVPTKACSAPLIVQILSTRRCSYRCPHCPVVSSEDASQEMSTQEIYDLLDYCASLGVLCIRFSGGESTLRKDFSDIVKYARKLGMRCALLSNCKQCSEELLDTLSEMCYVQTHLDSVNEMTFNKMTGGDNFSTFCNNIEKIRERGIHINAAATLQQDNLNDFKDIIDFCAHYDLVLKINTIYSDADGKFKEKEWIDYYRSTIQPFKKEWPKLKQYAKSIGCVVYAFCEIDEVDSSIDDPISVISPWGRTYIVIDSKGDVYPFPLIIKDEFKIGSIRNNGNLLGIWNNSSLLNKLRSFDKQALGCGNCRMDCVYCNLFFSYSYMGDFGKVLPNNDCPYFKHKLIEK